MRDDKKGINFIDRDKLYHLIETQKPSAQELDEILNKSLKNNGLNLLEVAKLLNVQKDEDIEKILLAAQQVKSAIYGKRLVIFAPIYTGNACVNNCTYCSFRKDNKAIKRKVLSMREIEEETKALLHEGHKRVLLICGESKVNDTAYIAEAIRTSYKTSIRDGKDYIRRINLELAPMEIEDFRILKQENIGTYVCFQETYDEQAYASFHPHNTPKADYLYRLQVMDRAMEGGIDDVGIGALFGLTDYRFEVLSMIEHATHLEEAFGCGPHTISIPRIEPAEGAPTTEDIPYPVSDADFKKIVAILRLALPYTGIILSTRENNVLRDQLCSYGVSQISAGSRTNPGSYSHTDTLSGSQFSTGDHRSLDEVISSLIDMEYIPSFCTGCYRKGRVGHDFMELSKPGIIKHYCLPNAIFTFKEYLHDFASQETQQKGSLLINKLLKEIKKGSYKENIQKHITQVDEGKRDIYF